MKFKVEFTTSDIMLILRHWCAEVESEDEESAEEYVKKNYIDIVREPETEFLESDYEFPQAISDDGEFVEVVDVEEA